MDVIAQVTSKGQVTIPKAVRKLLGITEGDRVVFRVQGHNATLARTPDLLDLAGAVSVPVDKKGKSWEEVLHSTRAARAATKSAQ